MCLQVDYESDEEETDEEDKEDQRELEEETEQDNPQEARPETAEAAGVRGRDGRKEEKSPYQMRVDAVLQASPAIQRYSFDQEHQLWCQVRTTAVPQEGLGLTKLLLQASETREERLLPSVLV